MDDIAVRAGVGRGIALAILITAGSFAAAYFLQWPQLLQETLTTELRLQLAALAAVAQSMAAGRERIASWFESVIASPRPKTLIVEQRHKVFDNAVMLLLPSFVRAMSKLAMLLAIEAGHFALI